MINNKIKEGKLISEIEIFFKSNTGKLEDFIAKGEVNLKLEILNNIKFNNANLNFIADKNDILIKKYLWGFRRY